MDLSRLLTEEALRLGMITRGSWNPLEKNLKRETGVLLTDRKTAESVGR
ncbi:MAG: hypothetical protein IJ794_11200 [Lachnospiraceae bacterium]|nr:hypothetical protein [Lachnospiraceae bacterium]